MGCAMGTQPIHINEVLTMKPTRNEAGLSNLCQPRKQNKVNDNLRICKMARRSDWGHKEDGVKQWWMVIKDIESWRRIQREVDTRPGLQCCCWRWWIIIGWLINFQYKHPNFPTPKFLFSWPMILLIMVHLI